MDANRLITKYCIDEDHLPQPGINIVQIVALDSEEYIATEGHRKVTKVRHNLWLSGFGLPLRLNNTRLKILIAMFGKDTDHWIGKKIGLFVGASQSYGEVERTVMIHLDPVDQSLPALGQAKAVTLSSVSRSGAAQVESGSTPHGFRLPATQASQSMDMTPIGVEAAAEVCCLLAERGKTWDDYRLHANATGYAEMIAGKMPGDCPRAIKQSLAAYIRDLPKLHPRPEPAKFLAMWRPRKAEVVDRSTGEVINPHAGLPGQPPAPIDEDDIPF